MKTLDTRVGRVVSFFNKALKSLEPFVVIKNIFAFPINKELSDVSMEPHKHIVVIIDEVPIVFQYMISTYDFEKFIIESDEIRRYINRRIKDLENKYIPSLTQETFGIRELLSNNVVMKILIEEIVPKRFGVSKKLNLKEKVELLLKNIKRTNLTLETEENIEDKYIKALEDFELLQNFRQQYPIAKAEIQKYKATGFLATIFNKINADGFLFLRNKIYKLKLVQKKDELRIFLPVKVLFSYEDFFVKYYVPLINNYVNALAIKYVWETREGLINQILKSVPTELVKLIFGASRAREWFIEVGDIGLEKRGDTYYLYKWTGKFALVEVLNSAHKGEIYEFPSFKVAVPFKVGHRKLEIMQAVIINPPTLHPFIGSSSYEIKSICFGSSQKIYDKERSKGDIPALLRALEIAVQMIREGYGKGARPYRTAHECRVKKITYQEAVRRKIPITNINDPDVKKLLEKWRRRK